MNYSAIRHFGGKVLFLAITLILIGSALKSLPAQAEDFMMFDTISSSRAKAVSFASEDGVVSLTAPKGTSSADVSFKLMALLPQDLIKDNYSTSTMSDMVPASDLYYFESSSYLNTEFSATPTINIKFNPASGLKSLYYFDADQNIFIKIDAKRDVKKNILSFAIPQAEKLTFGLFMEPPQVGHASWYVHPKYKKELMAASTEFSFGSKVKVTNLANGKEVIVTVKDYGPVKALHPDRVIDLGKEAFKKIASTGAGVIDVRVEAYIETKTTTTTATSTATKK